MAGRASCLPPHTGLQWHPKSLPARPLTPGLAAAVDFGLGPLPGMSATEIARRLPGGSGDGKTGWRDLRVQGLPVPPGGMGTLSEASALPFPSPTPEEAGSSALKTQLALWNPRRRSCCPAQPPEDTAGLLAPCLSLPRLSLGFSAPSSLPPYACLFKF